MKNFKTLLAMLALLILPAAAHADGQSQGSRGNAAVHSGQPTAHQDQTPSRQNASSHHVIPAQTGIKSKQQAKNDEKEDRHELNQQEQDAADFRYDLLSTPYIYAPLAPAGFESVDVDGTTYYYNEGTFYQESDQGLQAISPVVGAVVSDIPGDYRVVQVDGSNYLLDQGVYYLRVGLGFQVVVPPDF